MWFNNYLTDNNKTIRWCTVGKARLTTAEWVKQASKVHKGKYDYSITEYKAYGEKVGIRCPIHGVFHQKENNHRNGAGCKQCGMNARQSTTSHNFGSFTSSAKAVHGGKYTYPEQEIYNSRTKALVVCPLHGEFEQMVYAHLAGKGCNACGYDTVGKKSQISITEFIRRATEVHGDTYEYLSGLTGLHKNIQIKCPHHGVFKQTPHNHLKGATCPRCINKISKGESELADYVKSLGVEVVTSSRKVIAPYEVDIFIPEAGVAIEYNGLWFHREDLVKDKTRTKWRMCEEKGVKLIQVFEDEWLNNRAIVEARIAAALGRGGRYYARKCELGKISALEARAFLKQHHLQGGSIPLPDNYGLKVSGELVAVASFGPSRFGKADMELLRYASIGRVLGGISRLVCAFRREHPESRIVSYADLRWGDGNSYAKAGFTLDGVTEPDYWWADMGKNKRISRYSLQKSKTGMAEKEYAKQNKLFKVLGVGHKRWVI